MAPSADRGQICTLFLSLVLLFSVRYSCLGLEGVKSAHGVSETGITGQAWLEFSVTAAHDQWWQARDSSALQQWYRRGSLSGVFL